MAIHRRGAIARLGAALLTPTFPAAWAQDGAWPGKPINVVVPFTAGSGTDVVARAVCERVQKQLNQPMVIDNRPGAGGTLGASLVAGAPPDGYTLLIHSAGHVANAALYPKLRYDTAKDFRPIAMLATLPNVLVTSAASGVKTLGELVAKAKVRPGRQTYGSAGNGSATHINAEKFRIAAGIDATHVPYRGTPEAITDVIAGNVDWFFAPLVSALPLIKDGKLVPLAVGRLSAAPRCRMCRPPSRRGFRARTTPSGSACSRRRARRRRSSSGCTRRLSARWPRRRRRRGWTSSAPTYPC